MRHHHFQQQARGRRTAEVADPIVDLGRERGQRRRVELLRFGAEYFGAVDGGVDKPFAEGIRHGDDEQQVTQPVQQVEGETARLVAGLDHLVDGVEHRRGVLGGEGVDGGVEKREVRDPEQRQRHLVGQAVRAGARQQLIQHGQRVARRPAASADDQRVHVLVNVRTLLRNDVFQQVAHRLRGQQAERVVVGTRADRAEDLLRLGRRKDEDEVLWRLLHNLEQGVVAGG